MSQLRTAERSRFPRWRSRVRPTASALSPSPHWQVRCPASRAAQAWPGRLPSAALVAGASGDSLLFHDQWPGGIRRRMGGPKGYPDWRVEPGTISVVPLPFPAEQF
jgi:hypothetical protein